MKKNVYLLTYRKEDGEEDVMEIHAYSEEQAHFHVYETITPECFISLEHTGYLLEANHEKKQRNIKSMREYGQRR